MASTSKRADARRGFVMAAVVLFLMVSAGVGFALRLMSQQAGRSSHWFVLAQAAHGLADDALRQALATLARGEGPARDALVAALSRASGGRVTLLASDQPRTLTPTLEAQLAALAPLAPALAVTAAPVASGPLWEPGDPALAGLVPDARERTGRVRLVAKASVTRAGAPRVERTLTLECDFRLVSLAPPLLGRFVLFVERAGELPGTGVAFDPHTGDGVPSGAPLTVYPAPGVEVVEAATGKLDRGPLAAGFSADRAGWIYLGGAAGPWRLKLAHGHTRTGESPLLAAHPRRVRFRGSDAEDAAFRERFASAYRAATGSALDFPAPGDGLTCTAHGLASNAGAIGGDAGAASPAELLAAPDHASPLRLFGTPQELAPTLVFGPVLRVFARRAAVRGTRGDEAVVHPLHALAAHGPAARRVITAAFGGAAEALEHGTGVVEEPYAHALSDALDGASGYYTRSGLLEPHAPGRPPELRSRLLPWCERAAGAPGLPAEALERLWNAEPAAPALFTGNLAGGMRAFVAALDRKLAARLDRRTARRLPDGPRLELPGVVLIDQDEPYHLRAVEAVTRGGILVTRGRLVLEGDVRRGPGGEPLTLVSLTGDIAIAPRVRTIEAYLAAPRGTIWLPDAPLTITGGLACHRLDGEALRRSGAARALRHDPAIDPALPGPMALALGGDARFAVGGW